MKKVFSILSLILAVGVSSLFLFTSADKHLFSFLQKYMAEKPSPVPLVLVSVDESSVKENKSPFLPAASVEKCNSRVRELGAVAFSYDSGFKSRFVKIDSLVEKKEIKPQNEKSFFNIKIVFSGKNHSPLDRTTPELSYDLLPLGYPENSVSDVFLAGNIPLENDFPLKKRQLLVKKDGLYYADMIFSDIFESLGVSCLGVSSSEIVLKNPSFPNGLSPDSISIPRSGDGSVILKFPPTSWQDFKTVSFSEILGYSRLEDRFYSYLKIMAERGLFGELNSESPLSVYESSLAVEKDFVRDYNQQKKLKEKFFHLMNAYLNGNQEQILSEATGDEGKRAIIKNSFTTCRKLFSELSDTRENLSKVLDGAFCVLAITADSFADFEPSPFDERFPVSLEPVILANMIFSEDFVSELPSFFSLLISLPACFLFLLIAYRIKRRSSILLLSFFVFVLLLSALLFSAVCLRVFLAFFAPLSSILILSIIFSIFIFTENSHTRRNLTSLFSGLIAKKNVKKIMSAPSSIFSESQKNEATVLATSIRSFSEIRTLLNDNQLLSLMNHYFDFVFAEIIALGGVIESYRDDKIVAFFGPPISDEEHCSHAVSAALALKKCDERINEEIRTYPLSPKIDGMSDDLYTAFFILEHNKKMIASQSGLYSGFLVTACSGGMGKLLFKIIDDSWEKAGKIRDTYKKTGNSGVLLNEAAFDFIKYDYITRRLGDSFEILGDMKDDDERLWNYAKYWNQAIDLYEHGEKEKALAVFKKLSEGRPSDKVAKYFINLINGV
ncbi:adenylate/guanylate cyclase domain-containing protein [Treponema sp. UBA3813]|uniref:adenylate/guanylate cyclase domain-containing protein n=1 Tax=Treponema sp. UBA3813 TaxID=1947715 RepID=UPI0025E54E11|nr:adenylate/guanylate cyclase domain-containing protein [Treponema sp. UBA3813]